MKRNEVFKNQKGFTLIEIIAVLVILGVLAAVAIPKYVDLQNDARLRSIDGAIAAGGSNIYMAYSRQVLAGNANPTSAQMVTALNVARFQRVGDFRVAYAVGTAPAGCAQAVNVTYTAGPTAGYFTGTAPTRTYCVY